MKLELKHLAPYLPYGLKGKLPNGKYLPYQNTGLLISLNYKSAIGRFINVEEYDLDGNIVSDCVCVHDERYTPILRPMSDLKKEIEHDGEVFIPINKLYSIAQDVDWYKSDYVTAGGSSTEWWTTREPFCFGFNSEMGFYYLRTEKERSNEFLRIGNQQKLWDFLYELKFDVFGLIDAGIAISINDI